MQNQLKVGDPAPDFTLPDENHQGRTLKEFLGQKIVLVFFVGAFTSTCTKESCEFRDSMSRLIDLEAQVIAIDLTVPGLNRSFSEKNRLPFPVLSDAKREVIEKYGLEPNDCSSTCCWGKGCYPMIKRSILILDEKGIIRHVWISDNPESEPSYEQLQKAIAEMP